MLIYVMYVFIERTDGQTHVQLKTIVRNLTKKTQNFFFYIFFFTKKRFRLFQEESPEKVSKNMIF
jgi:hypothetical protein